MGDKCVGQSHRLSPPRRLICDLLHFARQIPSVPVQRRMDLRPVVQARQKCRLRPSWVVLFAKAYSLVAVEMPRLRQAYLALPYPHLYEHPESVATVAVEREYDGEEVPFFGHVRAPDSRPLLELDRRLRHYKSAPLWEVSDFRQALRLARLPRLLRRLAWWYGLNGSGPRRARRFGTFGVSVYSSLGVESLHPIAPTTTILNYGPISKSGRVNVRLVYDHRVLDGAVVGRALLRLEEVLAGPMVKELLELSGQPDGEWSVPAAPPPRDRREVA
jgi:hypothetical protein